jgi:hypothetical protein
MKPRHLTYANIASTLALVVALGSGGAFAAGLAKNSVGSAQLKPGAVKAADLAKNSVTGKAVKKDALTGKDIKESTLGTVPSAAKVDTLRRASATAAVGGTAPLVTRAPFTLSLQCAGTPGTPQAKLALATSGVHGRWVSNNGIDTDFNAADGPADNVAAAATAPGQTINMSVTAADGTEFGVVGVLIASGSSCWADVAVIG